MNKILIKGNKLFLENEKMIYLTKEMITKFSLKNKELLTDNELKELLFFRVKLSTYNLLVRRDYFIKEIKIKLLEKHRFPRIIDDVIEKFIEWGYLDDESRARSYIKLHKNYGPQKLRMIFYQMEVPKEIIEGILLEDNNEQVNKIKEQWLRLGNKDEQKKIASLMRKGFLYKDIRKTISSLKEEEEL